MWITRPRDAVVSTLLMPSGSCHCWINDCNVQESASFMMGSGRVSASHLFPLARSSRFWSWDGPPCSVHFGHHSMFRKLWFQYKQQVWQKFIDVMLFLLSFIRQPRFHDIREMRQNIQWKQSGFKTGLLKISIIFPICCFNPNDLAQPGQPPNNCC